MAPEKTEALLVTHRRCFQYPRIVLEEHEVEWKTSIKYLGVQLDHRLSFGEQLKITAAKAIQCGANLARLMPNIGGPMEAKRRQVASVVHPELLYAAPVWTNVLVLANVPPMDLLAEERRETFQLQKELTCTDLQEIARADVAIRKDGRCRLVEK